MQVTGFFADSKWAWASNKAESATDDFEFPAANVYATSALTALLETNNSWVFAGIVEYRKKNPKTGKHKTVKVGNINLSLDLAGVIIDENVDRVTFGLAAWDTGGGDWPTNVSSVNQVWIYE
ncbi:MAG TPA: hypothetical protein VIH91_11515 [Terriglobales bacterium]